MSAAVLDDYGWDDAADGIEEVMRRYYPDLLKLAYSQVASQLPAEMADTISFDVRNSRVQGTIDGLAKRIRNVSETTREDVRRIVEEGLEGGSSNASIAEQIRGAREIAAPARAMLIARTETGTALNLGHVLAYGDAGLTHVEVMDGEKDAICAAAHGQRWTLEEAQSKPLGHPGCTRSFRPLIGEE